MATNDTTKPKTSRKPRSVSSFPDFYLTAWKQATLEEIKLPVGQAKRSKIRHEMHALRRAMERENHPDAELVTKAEAVFDHYDPNLLILRPKESNELREIFQKAGVDMPEELSEESAGTFDNLFKDLKGE